MALAAARLIPRNNWDYGPRELALAALTSAPRRKSSGPDAAPNTAAALRLRPGQTLVWTNSGRVSLAVILQALGLPRGAPVGVPLFCCPVVFDAIHQAGLTPRFLDSNLSDGVLSVDDVTTHADELAALVAVHQFGNPCDTDALTAAMAGRPVIEDCAQALFSTYKGRFAGFAGTAAFFSFRCGKYVSAGAGSAIFCREEALTGRVAQIAAELPRPARPAMLLDALLTLGKATLYQRPWYGLVGRPVGLRLDERLNLTAKAGFEAGGIAATHLRLIEARMGRFEERVNVQREHAGLLLAALAGLSADGASADVVSAPGRTRFHRAPNPYTVLQARPDSCSNWQQFPLRFADARQRDAMAAHLLRRGIDAAKTLDDIVDVARRDYGYRGGCPNAELLSKTVLLAPIHYTLSRADMTAIARAIIEGGRTLRE